jgi:hypothetical protein
MNWFDYLLLGVALIVWCVLGLLWLCWLESRHQKAGRLSWRPRFTHVVFAGPAVWALAYFFNHHLR